MGILPHMEFYCTPLTRLCQWVFLFIPGKFSENSTTSPLLRASISPLPSFRQGGLFLWMINERLAYDGCTGAGAPDKPSPGEKVARRSRVGRGTAKSKVQNMPGKDAKTLDFRPHSSSAPVCALGQLLPGRSLSAFGAKCYKR